MSLMTLRPPLAPTSFPCAAINAATRRSAARGRLSASAVIPAGHATFIDEASWLFVMQDRCCMLRESGTPHTTGKAMLQLKELDESLLNSVKGLNASKITNLGCLQERTFTSNRTLTFFRCARDGLTQSCTESKEGRIVIDPAAPDILNHLRYDSHSACCTTLLRSLVPTCHVISSCQILTVKGNREHQLSHAAR